MRPRQVEECVLSHLGISSAWQKLGAVPSTLLIPLAARAKGAALFPQFDPHDLCANALLTSLRTNVQTYLNDWASVLNVLWRTDVIKRMGSHFFARHPRSHGVNLGAGLSHYFQWLSNDDNHWLDADLPEVISLRQLLLQTLPPHCRVKELNITQPGWWQRLELPHGQRARPVLLICEGVLMYLSQAQVNAILKEVSDNAPPGSEFIFDFISPLGVGHAAHHPSVCCTGAEFTWGIHNASELVTAHGNLEVLEQRSVSEAYGFACSMAESFLRPFTGGPMYGLIRLGVKAPAQG
jgi:O-methyltransferase involved in polyketide biosynthesis